MTDGTRIPSNSELEILHVLWRKGPQTVRQIHPALRRKREIRYTTVLKTLQVMAEKGLVARDETERSHVYRAAVPEKLVKRRLVSDLLNAYSRGRRLVSCCRLSPPSARHRKTFAGSTGC